MFKFLQNLYTWKECKVVKFHNGKYGIRKWNKFLEKHEYYDFITPGFWWREDDLHIDDSMTPDLETVVTVYNTMFPPVVPPPVKPWPFATPIDITRKQ